MRSHNNQHKLYPKIVKRVFNNLKENDLIILYFVKTLIEADNILILFLCLARKGYVWANWALI